MTTKVDYSEFNREAKRVAIKWQAFGPMPDELKPKFELGMMILDTPTPLVHRTVVPHMDQYLGRILECDTSLLLEGNLPLIPEQQVQMIKTVMSKMNAQQRADVWHDISCLVSSGKFAPDSSVSLMRQRIELLRQGRNTNSVLEEKVEEIKGPRRVGEDVADADVSGEEVAKKWLQELSEIEHTNSEQLREWFEKQADAHEKDGDGNNGVWGQEDDPVEAAEEPSASGEPAGDKAFYQVKAIFNRRVFEFVRDLKLAREKLFPILGTLFEQVKDHCKANPMTDDLLKKFREVEETFVSEYFSDDEAKLPLLEQMALERYDACVDTFLTEIPELQQYMVSHVVASFVRDKNRKSYENFHQSLKTLRQAALICVKMEQKLAPLGGVIDGVLRKLNIRPGQPIQMNRVSKARVANQVIRSFSDSRNQKKLKPLYEAFQNDDERAETRKMIELSMPQMLPHFDDLDRRIRKEQQRVVGSSATR